MIDGISIIGLTPPALLGVAILMMLTGRLIPRTTYLDKVKEADLWRQAYEAERDARSTADAQTVELLELAKTTNSFITAVFNNSERIRNSGDA